MSTTEDAPPRRRSTGRKIVIGLLAIVVTLALIVVGGGFFVQQRLAGQVTRIPDAFAGLPDRPLRAQGVAADSMNILLLGSDKREGAEGASVDARDGDQTWDPGLQRSDTIMVMHIAADRKSASIVSIPRDSWVDVPGYGTQKVNSAFSYGGPALTVETVENLTNLRIDHLAVIDWTGFKELTDALGGVTVQVPETTYDSARRRTWTKGEHELKGQDALDYVGQRYGLPNGDFDRVKRQQNFLRAMMQKTLSEGTLRSPAKIYNVLDAITKHLSVDESWSTGDMRNLAISLRDLRSDDVSFATVPTRGTGMEGAQSVVYLDKSQANALWGAMLEDEAQQWLEANPGGNLQAPAQVS